MRISRPMSRSRPAPMPSKPVKDRGAIPSGGTPMPNFPRGSDITQAGTLSPRGGVTGGARPVPMPAPMPAGGNMGSMPAGGNTGAPATSTFQGGTSGGSGMSGGVPNTSMPNTSMLPAGAAFKRGGAAKAKKMASGGMTSKASTASKRGDGIAQRGKTKGRMC